MFPQIFLSLEKLSKFAELQFLIDKIESNPNFDKLLNSTFFLITLNSIIQQLKLWKISVFLSQFLLREDNLREWENFFFRKFGPRWINVFCILSYLELLPYPCSWFYADIKFDTYRFDISMKPTTYTDRACEWYWITPARDQKVSRIWGLRVLGLNNFYLKWMNIHI